MKTELRYEKLARAKVIEFLAKEDMVHYEDGATRKEHSRLYNLSLTNLGLDTVIRVIAESVEKRVALGDFEETAWEVALDCLEFFLEGSDLYPDNSEGFARNMAEWWMPFVELPDGTVIHNPNASGCWQDGVWLDGVYYSRKQSHALALRIQHEALLDSQDDTIRMINESVESIGDIAA
jgi:hypothetical protein